MSLVTDLVCVCCGAAYAEGCALVCPRCGRADGILDVRYDLRAAGRTLTRASLAGRPLSHWRYRELLPLGAPPPAALAHIGWTPLIEAPRLAAALGVGSLRLKDEGRSASGSFKDRASSIAVARALEEGNLAIACASTGNAATSLAHCAAAAGVQANIFVSRKIPAGKLAQLLAYGARVFKVLGTYAEAYDLCLAACERFGWYNRNCAINAYLMEGKKTGGLEIAEQCAEDPPDWVVCSVGDGCSLAGIHKGLIQMRELGLVSWTARLLGVQAAGVAPIAATFARDPQARAWRRLESAGSGGDTYADSINVPVPRNWRKALHAVRDSAGAFVTVTDDEIMQAVRLTGRLSGVFAEPAAAAAIAGIAAARRQGLLGARASVVAVITGNGLKDVDGALRAAGNAYEIPPNFDHVRAIVERDE